MKQVTAEQLEETIRTYCKWRGITEYEFLFFLGKTIRETKEPNTSMKEIINKMDEIIKGEK